MVNAASVHTDLYCVLLRF